MQFLAIRLVRLVKLSGKETMVHPRQCLLSGDLSVLSNRGR
jgi:hypothetical protein